ncbi:MAG: hypothetical protein QM489_07945 [Candidatus Izemoplasma sp.]
MRGFERAKGFENIDFEMPRRATVHSAGHDIVIIEDLIVEPGEIKLAVTGIKAYMMDDEVLKLYPRSSLPRKYNLTIPNNVGIIDKDYYSNKENDGAIFIQLLNFGKERVVVKKGERIAQGIFEKYLISDSEVAVTAIRNGGFGSTD